MHSLLLTAKKWQKRGEKYTNKYCILIHKQITYNITHYMMLEKNISKSQDIK